MNKCRGMGDASGFSLIELMIVIVLVLVLSGAAFMSIQSGRQTSNDQYQIMALQQELRAVMDMVEVDIHDAGCDPMLKNDPVTGTVFGITEAQGDKLTFTYDINAIGILERTSEMISYVYKEKGLYRRTYKSSGEEDADNLILSNMGSNPFIFYDESNQVTTSVPQIRSVRVHLDTSDAPSMYSRQLERLVQMRNTRRYGS